MRLLGAKDPSLLPAVGDLGVARWWLGQWTPQTTEDHEREDQVRQFCDDHPDALWRTCPQGHLTGSAFVVDSTGQQALMLHHVKLQRWVQPGGHADGDGNLAAVAWREATEETGIDDLRLLTPPIDLDVHRIPARPDEPEHHHLDLRFVAVAPPGAEPVLNHESADAAWFTQAEIDKWRVPELSRLARRGFAAARQFRESSAGS